MGRCLSALGLAVLFLVVSLVMALMLADLVVGWRCCLPIFLGLLS